MSYTLTYPTARVLQQIYQASTASPYNQTFRGQAYSFSRLNQDLFSRSMQPIKHEGVFQKLTKWAARITLGSLAVMALKRLGLVKFGVKDLVLHPIQSLKSLPYVQSFLKGWNKGK